MNKILEEYQKMTCNHIDDKKPKGRIVMLLSAGFSYDKGYPLGQTLNNKFCEFVRDEFFLMPNGEFTSVTFPKTIYKKEDYFHDYNVYHNAYLLLYEIIKHYVGTIGKEKFDYEKFYDAIEIEHFKRTPPCFDIWSKEYRDLAKDYIREELPYEKLVGNLTIVYDQLIGYFLKNNRKDIFYEDAEPTIDEDPNYSNFLRFLKEQSGNNIIDVFSTNHDLVFESFRNIPDLREMISDGFDDYGSEFFGDITSEGFKYKCRLERYTGKYNTSIRLYKLHGSLDYVLFHKLVVKRRIINGIRIPINYAVPFKYVKIKHGIKPYDIYKTTRCKRKIEYSSTEIRPDFLSGTQTKISKYVNPLLYKKLFKQFARCLSQADKLIIVGYGCGDTKINQIINQNFKCSQGKAYMINPDAKNLVGKLDIKVTPINKGTNEGILECQ